MKHSDLSRRLALYSSLFLALGCANKTGLADATRPENPNAADVIGAQSVYVIEAQGQPLVVDWQPEQRGDLEVAMREGVAVVKFDAKGMKLLKDCRIDGKYGFVGVNTKEQVVSLLSAEEVKANLPAAGLGILVKLGGELGQTQSLDIAIVMVGKRKTTWAHAARQDVQGDCSGATHFVRGATIGAFAMRSGAKGKARTVAEIFGAGVAASAGSSKTVQNADGLLDACRNASPESETAPSQCGALIRLELVKLEEKPHPIQGAQSDAPKAEANEESQACPEGFVFSGGKCTRPEGAPTHACRYGDVQDCSVQCDKGNNESCDTLGVMFMGGAGVARNAAKAAPLHKKACDGGLANACFNYGLVLLNGEGVPKDEASAVPLFAKACKEGVTRACTALAVVVQFGQGTTADPARAAKIYAIGCRGGDENACSNLGTMFNGGIGVPKDEKVAAGLFKQACDGGNSIGCGNFAYMVEFGKGVAKNQQTAARIYERACQAQSSECVWLGAVYHAGIGVKKDRKRALAEYARSCDALIARGRAETAGESISCILVNELQGAKKSVDTSTFKMATDHWGPACRAGVERDCGGLALIQLHQGDRQGAKDSLNAGCKGGDAWGCELQRELKLK